MRVDMPYQQGSYKIYDNIEQVPVEIWNSIALKSSLTYSCNFWKLLYKSNIKGISDYKFIVIFSGKTPAFIACCYSYSIDLSAYLPAVLQKILQGMRSFFPSFLMAKVLEVGTPINIHTPPFLWTDDSGKNENAAILLNEIIKKISKEQRPFLTGIKDLGTALRSDRALAEIFSDNDFTITASEPNASIALKWRSIESYRASMKSYYRSKLDRHLNIIGRRNVTSKIVNEFAELAELFEKQWLTVFNKARGVKREVLNADFYKLFSTMFNKEAKAIVFFENEQMIGHALLLIDNDLLRWLYTGKEHPGNDSLYMYVLYKVIEFGIDLGVKKIDLGPTTYGIKQDFGASIDNLFYAFKINTPYSYFIPKNLVGNFIAFEPPTDKVIFKKRSP